MPGEDAVPQISHRSAQDQRQRQAARGKGVAVAPKQDRDHYQRQQRKKNERADFPVHRRIGEQTEGSALVLHVSDLE